MFDVPDEVSAAWVPVAAARGAVCVDNSGAFRMDPEVPLVVPEVNPADARGGPKGVIANPNCTTLSLIVAVGALHRAFGLEELVVASYQAASGAGQAGIDTLYEQLEKVGGTRTLGQRAGDVRGAVGDLGPFPAPLALNVVPWAGSLKDAGWSSEELKIRNESRKILGLPSLRVNATCVRVPVVTTHSVAVHARFSRPVGREAAWETLRAAPGVVLSDEPERGEYPTPADVVGTDPTWVGPGPRVARRPERHRVLRLRRQPAQGRGAQHRADRGAGRRRALMIGLPRLMPDFALLHFRPQFDRPSLCASRYKGCCMLRGGPCARSA